MAPILAVTIVTLVILTGPALTRDICFRREKPLRLKYFYPESVGYNITIGAGQREESRWMIDSMYFIVNILNNCDPFRLLTEIFRILVEEKLNYRVEVLGPESVSDSAPVENPSPDVCDMEACEPQANDTCCEAKNQG